MHTMEAAVAALPHLFRAGELLSSMMLFFMTTGSTNYDLLFFTPAFRSFDERVHVNSTQNNQYNTMMNFLTANFTIQEYAANFNFSDTETADQFFERFLKHLESQEKIPQNVRESIIALESYRDQFVNPFSTRGFIKPCPRYILSRIATLLAEINYGLKQLIDDHHEGSVDAVIQFLTEDFNPSVHGEGLDLNDEKEIQNIVAATTFGFVAENDKTKRLILYNGVQASTENKKFFEHILPKVPDNVKEAINTILPYL